MDIETENRDDYLSTEETLAYLGCNQSTLSKWLSLGLLGGYKLHGYGLRNNYYLKSDIRSFQTPKQGRKCQTVQD